MKKKQSIYLIKNFEYSEFCFHCFLIYLPWSDGPDAMILDFWMLSFKPAFSLSSFTFLKRLFSSSSVSSRWVVSSVYLRLLTFLPAILIPAYASYSPAFLMIYSAYNLNKQGDNIQPWLPPFPNFELVCCSNLDSILKSRDNTLSTKVCLVKAMIFPIVMYGCESWTVKKLSAEELMLINCGVGEDSWESLGLQGNPTSPS